MKFQDESQNLRVRLVVLQLAVLLLLGVLGVRLYLLQIVRGAHYAEMAENQRIRLLPIPAPRGVIFDRHGKILVDSRPIYNIIMSREDVRNNDLAALVEPLSAGLGVDPDFLRERFEEIKTQPQFESVKIKEGATSADISWVEAHALEHSELRVEAQPQRRYPADGTLAHVLGYVSEISQKQLDLPEYQVRGLKMGDIIGKEGLEQTYDHILRGQDGYRKVLVNSRGQIQETIETVEPQPGQSMVTTIDLEMQMAAEERLRTSPSKRGVIVAMNPNDGEILALASYPTFDPNLFTQRITTKGGRREYAALITDEQRPLYNRAIRGRYPPGSTWKIPMAMSGLMQGAISIKHSEIACGGGITIGNKFTRCMSQHGMPELRYAIEKSCDGYFYRLGLKMKLEGIEKMVEDFDINKRTGIDLPHELISWTPSREFKRRWNKTDPEWRDIDTVYASFGQVYDVVTPIAMLRAVAGIGVGGTLQVPHLFKQAQAVGETPAFAARPVIMYEGAPPKVVPLAQDQHRFVVEGMWNVVNRAGTGRGIKMENFEIAGKTGTAQVAKLGADVGDKKDHSWFVSYAPAYKPEIAMIALIENVGFGGTYAAPASRAVYDVYYRETRGEDATVAQVAQR